MSSKVKAGLFFGISMAIWYAFSDLVLEESPHNTKEVFIIIMRAILCGGIAGVLFGWSTGKFASSKFVANSTKIETELDEPIIFQGGANHFKGMESVGGKLYLTTTRLIFKSHKLNIQNHQLFINLSDIIETDKYKVLGISSKGLNIKTRSLQTEKFVVEKPDEWIQHLKQKENGVQHRL